MPRELPWALRQSLPHWHDDHWGGHEYRPMTAVTAVTAPVTMSSAVGDKTAGCREKGEHTGQQQSLHIQFGCHLEQRYEAGTDFSMG